MCWAKDPMAQRQSLSEDVGHFDAALLALRTGNDEVLPPHEAAQQAQLGEAGGSYGKLGDLRWWLNLNSQSSVEMVRNKCPR